MATKKTNKTRKIAVGISKGGAGKTTTTAHLAVGLARKGYKVLIVDTDTQDQCRINLGCDPAFGLVDLVLPYIDEKETKVHYEDVIHQHEEIENLHIIKGSGAIAGLDQAIFKASEAERKNALEGKISQRQFDPRYLLTEALYECEGNYDFVLLDTSPRTNIFNMNTLYYADDLLIPISLRYFAQKSFDDTLQEYEFIREKQKVRHAKMIEFKYLVPTFFKRANVVKAALEQTEEFVKENYPGVVVFPPIPDTIKFDEASRYGKTIFDFDSKSNAAAAYQILVEVIAKNGSKN